MEIFALSDLPYSVSHTLRDAMRKASSYLVMTSTAPRRLPESEARRAKAR